MYEGQGSNYASGGGGGSGYVLTASVSFACSFSSLIFTPLLFELPTLYTKTKKVAIH